MMSLPIHSHVPSRDLCLGVSMQGGLGLEVLCPGGSRSGPPPGEQTDGCKTLPSLVVGKIVTYTECLHGNPKNP